MRYTWSERVTCREATLGQNIAISNCDFSKIGERSDEGFLSPVQLNIRICNVSSFGDAMLLNHSVIACVHETAKQSQFISEARNMSFVTWEGQVMVRDRLKP